MKISEIIVGKGHRKDLGDLSDLSASINQVGMLHPIVLNKKKEVRIGRRRLAAAILNGWKDVPAIIAENLDDFRNALIAERDENECRKDFTPSEAVALAADLEPAERKDAEARKRNNLKIGKISRTENFTAREFGRSEDKAAEAVGLSRPSLERAKAVVAAAESHPKDYGDIAEEMDRTGKITPAYKKLAERAAEPERPKVKLPHNGNGAPWHFSKSVQVLYEQFNIVKKNGGIEKLLEEWEEDEAKDYLKVLRDVRARCDEYIPALERKLKCKQH
jgi:hypothetical protein